MITDNLVGYSAVEMLKSIKITPFLIIMPFLVGWALYSLFVVISQDGMKVMMSDYFLVVLVAGTFLLVLDRTISRYVKSWILSIVEVFLLVGAWYLLHPYL